MKGNFGLKQHHFLGSHKPILASKEINREKIV